MQVQYGGFLATDRGLKYQDHEISPDQIRVAAMLSEIRSGDLI